MSNAKPDPRELVQQLRNGLRFLDGVLIGQGFSPDSAARHRVSTLLSILNEEAASLIAQRPQEKGEGEQGLSMTQELSEHKEEQMVRVPREPTEKMIEAGRVRVIGRHLEKWEAKVCYNAMLLAAEPSLVPASDIRPSGARESSPSQNVAPQGVSLGESASAFEAADRTAELTAEPPASAAPHGDGDALRMPEEPVKDDGFWVVRYGLRTFRSLDPLTAWGEYATQLRLSLRQALTSLARKEEELQNRLAADTNTIELLADQVRQLQSSLLQAEQEARRYRWLKANHLQTGPDSWIRTGDDLEEAIDRAIGSVSSPEPSLLNSERGGGGAGESR